jgi:hypothetical protein
LTHGAAAPCWFSKSPASAAVPRRAFHCSAFAASCLIDRQEQVIPGNAGSGKRGTGRGKPLAPLICSCHQSARVSGGYTAGAPGGRRPARARGRSPPDSARITAPRPSALPSAAPSSRLATRPAHGEPASGRNEFGIGKEGLCAHTIPMRFPLLTRVQWVACLVLSDEAFQILLRRKIPS